MSRLRSGSSELHWGQHINVNPVAIRRVSDAGLVACISSPSNHAHPSHSYATLVYHVAGQATFEQNGRWDVGPGDVMLIPAGQRHRRLAADNPEYWGLGICMPCFGTNSESMPDPFERVRQGAGAVASISSVRQAYTVSLFQELSTLANGTSTPNPAVQRSLLTLILNEVQTALLETQPSPTIAGGVAADALRFIEAHCLRPLTLREVARAVGRSDAYVTTALSRATGKSALEWITAYRLAQARTLLTQTDERIDLIAERVGYGDTTHFIRMFRRTMGLTPAAYRAKQRSTPLS